MPLSLELKAVLDEFVVNEAKFIFNLLSISEIVERKGLKNISRYIKATAYSRQTIITKLFRSLKIPEEAVSVFKILLDDYLKQISGHINNIEDYAKKFNLAGCSQTMYFAKETIQREQEELNKIFDCIQNMRDIIYKQIVVCPLCGLVITEDLDKCPLCGANKAIFRTF